MILRGKWKKGEYKLLKLVGVGSFGRVYKGVDKDGNIRAIKISKDLLSITNEYNAMVKLRGLAFIPTIYDIDDCHIKGDIYHFIVMDYIEGKNLKEIGNYKMINVKTVFKIGNILAKILEKIHGLGYRYTDIKLDNIILDKKAKIYFVDFGSLIERHMPTKEYTPTYNIKSWRVNYNYNYNYNQQTSILFSLTMIMVTLIGRKEYNPLIYNIEQVIDEINKFFLTKKQKQFLIDGLTCKFYDFSHYKDSLSLLLEDERKYDSLNKIDYILIASIVSFVFTIVFGVKSILS